MAEWSDVTIGEFAALKLAASPNAADRHDAYVRALFNAGRLPFNDAPPILTDAGRAWLATLPRRVTFLYRSNDAAPARKLAREIQGALGTLACLNA